MDEVFLVCWECVWVTQLGCGSEGGKGEVREHVSFVCIFYFFFFAFLQLLWGNSALQK